MKEWATMTTDTVVESLKGVVNYLPNVFVALLVVLLGILVAWAVKTVLVRVLKYVKLKPYTDAIGLNKVFPYRVEVAELVGDLAKWIIIIVFLIPAFDILGLAQVGDVVKEFVNYTPNVIRAVATVIIGAIVADLLARLVESTAHTIGAKTAAVGADVSRWAVVVFAVLFALAELGIATTFINYMVIGFIAMVSGAGILAFGLGGQDAAREAIDRVRKNLPK